MSALVTGYTVAERRCPSSCIIWAALSLDIFLSTFWIVVNVFQELGGGYDAVGISYPAFVLGITLKYVYLVTLGPRR